MTKALKRVGIKGTFVNIVNTVYDKPTINIILNGKKLKPCPLTSGMKKEYPLSPLLFNTVGIPSQSNKTRERNTKDSNREGRNQIVPNYK
jgi:hypothetical protein